VRLNEFHSLVEPDIGAISVVRPGLSIVKVGVVEIIIPPKIGGLADAAALMGHDMLESAIKGTIRIIVAKVPFPEHSGPVAVGTKQIGQGRLIGAENRTPPTSRPGSVPNRTVSGHQRAAGGRTERLDVKIGQPSGLLIKTVDVRRLDPRISGAAQISIALIVGNDEYDIRLFRFHCMSPMLKKIALYIY